jgi:multicomponent Na+:H+ antiporter subunit D
LLLFALLAFGVLMRTGIHPPEIKAVNIDTDWSYRWFLPKVVRWLSILIIRLWTAKIKYWQRRLDGFIAGLYRSHGPEGRMASVWPIGSMVIWIAVLLSATLILNFIA